MKTYQVTNIRHKQDLGIQTQQQILDQLPNADLSGAPFRVGKFILTCEEIKPKKAAKPKQVDLEDSIEEVQEAPKPKKKANPKKAKS